MIRINKSSCVLALGWVLAAAGTALAQDPNQAPPLPFEGPDGAMPERLGVNSFGVPQPLQAVQNDVLPLPDPADLVLPPDFKFKRIYLTVCYYGCRPWFVHPYTGARLRPTDVLADVGSDNPEVAQAFGDRTLEELLKVDPELGEAPVALFDDGIVNEDNEVAVNGWNACMDAEGANAKAVGVDLGATRSSIIHAPYYGLYCLRVRICVPYINGHAGLAYRYWLKLHYRIHQPYCWSTWWWWRHYRIGNRYSILPWRPLCRPCTRWVRSGPDWVWHVTNVNRYRNWCLYGLRYYCTRFGRPPFDVNPVPLAAELRPDIAPADALTTGWLRPWPYPKVRYWPFRPYCTRWYWFRPLPWLNYRYLPPVVHCAYAAPVAARGGGFAAVADDLPGNPSFPVEPPQIDEAGQFALNDVPQGAEGAFARGFDIIGSTLERPVVRPVGDRDGDGMATLQDLPRPLKEERGIDVNIDALVVELPGAPGE